MVALVAGAVLLPGYRHHVGIDGVAYLAIAERWAAGDVSGAINTYWSPLLSWLAAVPIALGLPPVAAGHLATLGGGAVALVGMSLAGARLGHGRTTRLAVGLASVPFVLEAANQGVFADLLVAGPVLVAVALLAGDEAPDETGRRPFLTGLAAGGALGVAALAKAVALPFAVGLLLTASVVRWVTSDTQGRIRAARAITAAVAGLLLVAGPWAVVVSLRSGTPSFGTAASHNTRVMAPGSQGVPIHSQLLPPSDGQLFAWEDPARIDVGPAEWSPDGASASRFGDNVVTNLGRVVETATPHAVGLLLAAVGAVVALRERRTRAAGLLVLAAAAGWTAAHVLVVVESRYLMTPLLCCLVLAGSTVEPLTRLLGQRARIAVAAVAGLLLVGVLPASVDGLGLRWRSGEDTRFVARLAAADGADGARVASFDRYQRSSVLCLHAGCRYWGVLDVDDPVGAAREAGLEVLLDWGGTDVTPAVEQRLLSAGARREAYGEELTLWLLDPT